MDSYTLLYIAGFFFLIGAVVVGIIWALVSFVRKGRHKNTSSTSSTKNLEEIARLMRDKQSQDLVVQMDGKSFNAVQELSSTQEHRLSFTSNVLVSWLEQAGENNPSEQADEPEPTDQPELQVVAPEPAELVTTPEPAEQVAIPEPAAPVAEPEPVEQVTTTEPADQLETPSEKETPELDEWIPAESLPVDQNIPHVPPFEAEGAAEVKPVSTQLPDLMGDILKPKPKPEPAYKSIAMQINDILQERMAGTAFETRGITVSDAADHGVSVSLDGEEYSGVKEIPDEAVRNLIRSAVLEWEKQGKENSD